MIPLKRFSGHIYEQKHLNIGYILPLTHPPSQIYTVLLENMNCRFFFLQRTERIRRNHLAIKGDGSKLWPGIKQWSSNELEAMKDSFYGKRNRTSVVSNCWKKVVKSTCTLYIYKYRYMMLHTCMKSRRDCTEC